MGTSLNGLTPAGTYPGLIKTGDNAPIDGTLKTLSDGNGNNLPMSVSTTTINLTGTAQVGGVAIANTTQLAAKQDTLVSGTNIKTINGTSVLGSGDIVTPYTPPSGVAGAIQFSNGSAFASDAANLFWDDTNNRLGVGTNAPTQTLSVNGNISATSLSLTGTLQSTGTGDNYLKGSTFTIQSAVNNTDNSLFISTASLLERKVLFLSKNLGSYGRSDLYLCINNDAISTNATIADTKAVFRANGNISIGTQSDLSARLGVRGSGSTSATTSLLVQNSAGTPSLKIDDSGVAKFGGSGINGTLEILRSADQSTVGRINQNSNIFQFQELSGVGMRFLDGFGGTPLYLASAKASINKNAVAETCAQFEVVSTTGGILFPRMTTTQKNAIASPASGLVVYDTTLAKLCVYTTTWETITSL